jgi:predicted nucleic acid-binding protein
VKVFVDTSALVALLDEDDQWHSEAARLFRWLLTTTDLVTSNYVQLETVALVRRPLGSGAVARLNEAIFPAMTTLWVDEATHTASLAVHAGGGRASLVDQVSFAVMRQQGIEQAFTFDRDFELQGFRRAIGDARDQRGVHEGAAQYGSDVQSSALVSVAEIAARAGRPVNTVQSWRRRYDDFPLPVTQLAAGPIWNWSAVDAWIAGRAKRSAAAGSQRSDVR